MKKIFIPILLAIFFLAGCANQGAKLTDDQLFEKKKECASYKNEIEKNLGDSSLEEIFYSPILNSCLYITQYYDSLSEGYEISIHDYFQNKAILTTSACLNLGVIDYCGEQISKKEINKKIKELKGE